MAKNEWPAWRYDPKTGQGKIFNSEADVPKGWIDDPGKCKVAPFVQGEAESRSEPSRPAPKFDAPAPAESPNKGLAKQHGLTKKAMLEDFKANEIEVDGSLSADDLAALYLETFEEDPEGGEEDPGEE
jgi:hypothetical protein